MHLIDNINYSLKHRNVRTPCNDTLIPDVWCIVASFLKPSSLSKLCLTSSYFLEICRPILYRHLVLGFDSRYTNLTLKLLCFHKTLAHHVTSITIHAPFEFPRSYTRRTRSIRRWKVIRKVFPGTKELLIEAITRMNSLQTIRMHNSVFMDSDEERSFVQKLKECNVPVSNFALIANFYLGRVELSENGFMFSNLTTLTWDLRGIHDRDHGKSYSVFSMYRD
jgi:hypothetical protein